MGEIAERVVLQGKTVQGKYSMFLETIVRVVVQGGSIRG